MLLAQTRTSEMTLALALATADLAQAIASEDPARIAAASQAVRSASEAARQTLGALDDAAAAAAATAAGVDRPGPGAGVEVRMARADWNSGHMNAAILRALLEELDYTVSDPSVAEIPPGDFYPGVANGEFDFWAHGWFPTHDQYLFAEDLANELPDGGVIGDYVSIVGTLIPGGVLQGILADKKSADEFGARSMADIAANPGPWDRDGNGLADISGCDDGWGCQAVIDATIALNGWEDSVEQISASWAELWEEELGRLERGEPVLTYMWTPTAYIVTLTPGSNGYWMSFPQASLDQRQAAPVPEGQCPAQPCLMGFAPADISVVANNGFLAVNPAAAKIFELFTIDVLDVALQNVRREAGEDSEADLATHAAEWIADNRDLVDSWLAQARAAA